MIFLFCYHPASAATLLSVPIPGLVSALTLANSVLSIFDSLSDWQDYTEMDLIGILFHNSTQTNA